MLLSIIKLLLVLSFGVVVLTIFEDPKWIAQGIARRLHRPRTIMDCRRGRCR